MTREPAAPVFESAHDDPEVVRVLEFYLAELEAGRPPDRSTLLAEHPGIAGPLAECLDGLDFLHKAVPPTNPLDPITIVEDRLDDFRLIRAIGRGGMGVVYEAEQESLGRRVAVKTLPLAAGLNDGELRRFQHESRAAAALDHPHIVPVYAVGYDRGVHYFAMRLVPGYSLAELVDRPGSPIRTTHPNDRPADATDPEGQGVHLAAPGAFRGPLPHTPRHIADLIRQAADALGHAHSLGIVHRDVKPANLLLEGDHLWVADFGLAFVPGLSRLTHPDALVGTLRYMSPEQVEPRRGVVDHRADLYGLGATLYELLTRRPVFGDADRAVLISRILHDEPVPPRAIDPGVPVDLETIVLKLLAKDPARRYASMADLADDLRRFREGRPVLAQRPSFYDRAVEWVSRHRRATILTALGVLVLMMSLVWNQARVIRERDEKLVERQETREAVDDLYIYFAEVVLAHEPRQEPRLRSVLTKAMHHYERLARMPAATRDDRLSAAKGWRRVADISTRLGDHNKAEAAYNEAHDRLRGLASEEPSSHETARELGICANDRGNLLRSLGRLDEAGRDYQTAAERFRFLGDAGSADPFDLAALAGVENNQGLLWQLLERPTNAEACFRAARTRFAKLAKDHPDRPEYVSESATCCHNLACVLAGSGRDADADPVFREALVLRDRAAELAPRVPSYRHERARTQTVFAESLMGRQRFDDAETLLRPAIEAWVKLTAEYPDTPAYADGLTRAQRGLGAWDAGRKKGEPPRRL